MMRARVHRTGKVTAAALLATASIAALLAGLEPAAAQDCAGPAAAPPATLATPSMLYDTLRSRTNAQMLAITILRKPVAQTCPWIYEVRVLTASGSVVELDFDAKALDLVGARGPENDRDAAALVAAFGGDSAVLTTGPKDGSGAKGSSTASNSGKGSGGGGSGGGRGDDGGDDHGDGRGGDGGGEGGEGGNSGPGGGGDSGGEGGDGGGEGGDGGGEGGGDD